MASNTPCVPRTGIISPRFCDVDTWRDVVRNNEGIHHVEMIVRSGESWLPKVLVDAGFFSSGSQVKKNRPDLWRDREPFDHVSLQWAQVEVWP